MKTKVAEAQDFVVINSGPSQGSLADEFSALGKTPISKAKPFVQERSLSAGSDDGADDSGDESPRKRVMQFVLF